MKINDLIVDIANSYIGQKEKPNNSGFYDQNFEEEMISMGWEFGWAWCSIFAKLCWHKAYSEYKPDFVPIIDKLFNPSAIKTYANFDQLRDWEVGRIPVKGSVIIFQYFKGGKPQWTGHAGIVVTDVSFSDSKFVSGTNLETIEGNTNALGGREGDCVAKKTRTLDFEPKDHGLVLLGFIHPIQ